MNQSFWLAALALSLGFPAAALCEDPEPTLEIAPGIALPDDQSIDVTYNGYFLGLRVMKVVIDIDKADGTYEADAGLRTAGLAGFFKEVEINATAQGQNTDAGVSPIGYEHRNAKSKKNRVIRINFDDQGIASPYIHPPFGSLGDPAPTTKDLTGAFDPLSTLVALSTRSAGCGRTVPVFDGKQRYDLRFTEGEATLVSTRGYRGAAIKCEVYYTPVSGFDPEDLADAGVYKKPFVIWLPDDPSVPPVPVRIKGDVSGFSVAIEARDISRN
jgi:hypothetical protein